MKLLGSIKGGLFDILKKFGIGLKANGNGTNGNEIALAIIDKPINNNFKHILKLVIKVNLG